MQQSSCSDNDGQLESTLKFLVCPKCKGSLKKEYVEEALMLHCHHCRLGYPVKDEIPVMLQDEAIEL